MQQITFNVRLNTGKRKCEQGTHTARPYNSDLLLRTTSRRVVWIHSLTKRNRKKENGGANKKTKKKAPKLDVFMLRQIAGNSIGGCAETHYAK